MSCWHPQPEAGNVNTVTCFGACRASESSLPVSHPGPGWFKFKFKAAVTGSSVNHSLGQLTLSLSLSVLAQGHSESASGCHGSCPSQWSQSHRLLLTRSLSLGLGVGDTRDRHVTPPQQQRLSPSQSLAQVQTQTTSKWMSVCVGSAYMLNTKPVCHRQPSK